MTAPSEAERLITGVADGGALYPIAKLAAHRAGALHLAVSIFIFAPGPDGTEALLIQRRAAGKYHCGGLWANACCSHPDWGEDIAAAAERRLREELGLDLPLRQTATLDYRADVGAGLIENERVHVFSGRLQAPDAPISPDPEEVSETRWTSLADVSRDAADHPARYAPWFLIYLSRWAELNLA